MCTLIEISQWIYSMAYEIVTYNNRFLAEDQNYPLRSDGHKRWFIKLSWNTTELYVCICQWTSEISLLSNIRKKTLIWIIQFKISDWMLGILAEERKTCFSLLLQVSSWNRTLLLFMYHQNLAPKFFICFIYQHRMFHLTNRKQSPA